MRTARGRAYAGTPTTLPSEGSAEVLVHGASTLKVKPAHVLNGGSVTFRGDVDGRPLPGNGKLVELQVRLTHEWSTFRTIRSGPGGEWSIEYPFKRSCGTEEYPFRAELPGEPRRHPARTALSEPPLAGCSPGGSPWRGAKLVLTGLKSRPPKERFCCAHAAFFSPPCEG